MGDLQAMYDEKYRHEEWKPLTLRPDALSANRYDDTFRLLKGETGKLLEIGCGSGQLAMALGPHFDEVTGVDLSRVRIERATAVLQERYPELARKVRFVVGDGDKPLPFPDKSFDVVVACAIIEHVVDIFGLMDEIARVCKPGGCVVLTVPNICYVRHVWDQLLGRVPLTGSPKREIAYWRVHGWDGGHFHYFSKATTRDFLRHVGFEPEAWTGDGKFSRLRRWYINFVGTLTVRARRR